MRRRASLALCLLAIVILGGALMLVACGQDQARERVTPSPERPTVALSTATLPAPSPTRPATLPAATTTPSPTVEMPLPTPEPSTTVAPVEPTATATLPPSPLPPTASPSSTSPAAGPAPALSPVAPRLVKHGDRSQPWVALTFDACQTAASEAGYDAAIIDTLIETETPATLFLGGLWMQSHPTQTQYLASIPYFELGNHSWSHLDFQVISPEVMAAEITRTQAIMYQLTGRQPVLFRFPFGTWSPTALQVVAQHGLESIQWDLVTGDPDPNILAEDIVRVVSKQVQNGSIIIMHMNTRGWHTAEALPAIIEELSDRGVEFVTVSQMVDNLPPETPTPATGNATVKQVEGGVHLRQEPTTDSPVAPPGSIKWNGDQKRASPQTRPPRSRSGLVLTRWRLLVSRMQLASIDGTARLLTKVSQSRHIVPRKATLPLAWTQSQNSDHLIPFHTRDMQRSEHHKQVLL